ncbi:MAG: serine/threonine-protein phosphatase [Acidimicrobiia bacterium]|nr:serine/threonine-protein phosphatase [Acidimicrobiia bacterium]
MLTIDMATALRTASGSDPAGIPDILAKAAAVLEVTDLVVYLIDFGQTVLEPLPDRAAHAELPVTESVTASMAGRAFTDQEIVSADRADGVRVWIPVREGSDHTGVVAVTLPVADESRLRACAELGLLAGYLISAQARCTDLYNLYRRRRRMSLAASMQWDLLPPLVLHAGAVAVAGLVEPAYDVGGDCFDYAANGPLFDFAIMDAMGHGLGSAIIASLAMGCYRHDRREGRPLATMHANLGSTVASHYDDRSFATGMLGRIDIETGVLTWTNAGHPLPLLIRNGRVVGQLACPPTPPWGIGGASPTVATECLEPGDGVLVYTDGVTEARDRAGQDLGIERLIDLTDRTASDLLRPERIVRHLVRSVRDHLGGDPVDDATVVLVRWAGPQRP